MLCGIAAGTAFVLAYVGLVLWEPGQRLDDVVFRLALAHEASPVATILPWLARRVIAAVLLVVLGTVALVRWRDARRDVLVATVGVGVSVVVSRLLRDPLLWRPDHGHGLVGNTFPSTHMTLVVALSIALLMLLPRHRRMWGQPLAGLVVVAALGNVVGHAHRPSDTLGSVLLTVAIFSLVPRASPASTGLRGPRAGRLRGPSTGE